jgi:hypothetical protein
VSVQLVPPPPWQLPDDGTQFIPIATPAELVIETQLAPAIGQVEVQSTPQYPPPMPSSMQKLPEPAGPQSVSTAHEAQ